MDLISFPFFHRIALRSSLFIPPLGTLIADNVEVEIRHFRLSTHLPNFADGQNESHRAVLSRHGACRERRRRPDMALGDVR